MVGRSIRARRTAQPGHDAVEAVELFGEGVQDAVAAQPAAGHSQFRVEFVQVPAQSILDAGAFSDQVTAVID
jgi:hypothetical protein